MRFSGGMAPPLLPVYSLPKMASGLWWAACGNGASGDMADLAGGVISLLVAAVFLAILAYAVPSVPLWIVILVGFALMVASFIETWRSDQSR